MDLCGFCGVQHLGYNREDMIAPASVFKAFLLYNLWWKSYKISLWMKSVHSQDLGYCIVGEVCSLHTTHPCCQLLQDLVSAAHLETGQGVTSREWSPQNPSAACVRNELWGSLKQMNELHLAGHAVNAFSEIQVVWERRQVTERWHNLDNGDLAFRRVHFKVCVMGQSTKRKYFCVKYAVRWKKNTKLEAQVTFLLLHQDVWCNKRILAFSSKSSFKRNQDWNFSGEKGFYWMCVLIF